MVTLINSQNETLYQTESLEGMKKLILISLLILYPGSQFELTDDQLVIGDNTYVISN